MADTDQRGSIDLDSARPDTDGPLLLRLRQGDASAFESIVVGWSPMLLRVARSFVSTDASAQEIVQETWLQVVRGLHRFEGRSTLKTWVFSILVNIGRTTGVREARSLPWSLGPEDTGTTVDPRRFRGPGQEWTNHWTSAGEPVRWQPSPEDAAIAAEIRTEVARALEQLPERQRIVVALRDVHGMSSDEVCDALGITGANQRVLLHRGRARMRESLEQLYEGSRGVTR